jgi:cysteinyl-tRNA synthetase
MKGNVSPMQDLKAKSWNWWSRAALSVIPLAGATAGVLICYLALSRAALGTQSTTDATAGRGGSRTAYLRRTGVLTFTSVATAYLPIVLNGSGPVVEPMSLAAVNDFLYQLQGLDPGAIGNTAYDLVVMDYSADGTEAGEFTPAQIAALKHSPGGEKIVLAYMSIGEAEDYRFYWQEGWTPGNPSWLDAENPDWPGNYKVRYWDPGWQSIISGYTDRLLDAGFDGAYLDIIDAYEYYADRGRTTAAQEMADFVAAIRAHARARDPDFYVFPQNAPQLAEEVPAYLGSVDGIGQEDIYYGYDDDDVMTPPAVTAELEGYLDVFKNGGKLVLTVDYATTPAHVDDAYARSQARGYVPFATVRDLDQLTINPGHEPD